MNNIIAWEDLSIKTDLIDGIAINSDDFDDELEEEESTEELITTPFGIYHLKDFFNPMKQYDWHICHTNFNINQKVLETFSKLNGVEKIMVLSRYRLLVAFGKAFNSKTIKKDINFTFQAGPPISDEVLDKIKDLRSLDYDNWFIYYQDYDNWEHFTDEPEKIVEYREKQKKDGGLIITHETDI